ncbi:MAG: hypothetical protein ACP5JW_05270 [Candidatus Bathyarchaeia archaeon]
MGRGCTTKGEFIRQAIRFFPKWEFADYEYIEIPKEKYEKLNKALKDMGIPYYNAAGFIEDQIDKALQQYEKFQEEAEKAGKMEERRKLSARSVASIVKLQTFGNVNGELVKRLMNTLVECYERLGPPMTYSVNLNIFETSGGQGFFASHDALQGKPTINIYLDRISCIPFNIVEAGIRRQAAHSILHGSPEFYKIKFPEELKQAIYDYGLPENFATEILYGAAMAAKEYSVTKFLVEGGFIEDQAAYAKYMLKPTAEELQAWDMAKSNSLARIIYLTMTIRDVSCAIPLLEDSRFSYEIRKCLKERIGHLPENYKSAIQKIIGEMFRKFSEDIFKNVNMLVKAFVEDIIRKELTTL